MTFEEMVKENVWHSKAELSEFIEIIKDLASAQDSEGVFNPKAKWHWFKSDWANKYITLRIDMRDGGFILTNDRGKRISLDILKEQRE